MEACFIILSIILTLVNCVKIDVLSSPSRNITKRNVEFKFLGWYRKTSFGRGSDVSHVSEKREAKENGPLTSYYFLSQNSASWSTSLRDCLEYLGEDTTLLFIETQEELDKISEFLSSSDDTGTQYWTGGRYDPYMKMFTWDNGIPFEPWIPWDEGYPDTRTVVTKVSIHKLNSLNLRTLFQTVSNRYICELKSGSIEEATACLHPNDLIIVLDSSRNVGRDNYATALEFTVKMSMAWGQYPGNRVGIIVYSNKVKLLIGLEDSMDIAEFKEKVYKAPFLDGENKGNLGLHLAYEEFDRNDGKNLKNLIFVTNSPSTWPPDTGKAAEKLRELGVNSYAIAVGGRTIASELLSVAGHVSDNVIKIEKYEDLMKLLQPLSRKICGRI